MSVLMSQGVSPLHVVTFGGGVNGGADTLKSQLNNIHTRIVPTEKAQAWIASISPSPVSRKYSLQLMSPKELGYELGGQQYTAVSTWMHEQKAHACIPEAAFSFCASLSVEDVLVKSGIVILLPGRQIILLSRIEEAAPVINMHVTNLMKNVGCANHPNLLTRIPEGFEDARWLVASR